MCWCSRVCSPPKGECCFSPGGENANGYTFAGMDNSALNSALDRAIRTYQCATLPAGLCAVIHVAVIVCKPWKG